MVTKDNGAKNKQIFIDASLATIEKYKERNTKISVYSCAFCQAVGKGIPSMGCGICPMALREGRWGCTKFMSFENLMNSIDPIHNGSIITPETELYFEERIHFHKEYLIPLIKSLPDEQFTENGFVPINHDWGK